MVIGFLVGVLVGLLAGWLYRQALRVELADDLGMME